MKKYNSKIKIAMLCSSISRQAGGLFNSIRLLSAALSDINQDIYVLSGKDFYTSKDLKQWPNSITLAVHNKIKPDFFGFQIGIFNTLRKFEPDILHLHGIWMYPALVSFIWKKITKKVLVVSPRGMLDPWAVKNSRFKKIIAELLYAKNNLKNADCIHALNFDEYKSIRYYGLNNPVAIIPNAINFPKSSKSYPKNKEDKKKKILLFIGRIHPKKGLKNLIKAWKILDDKNQLQDWTLVIGGWSQLNHEDYLKKESSKLNLNKSVKFVGPLFGAAKEKQLLNASAFILPSYSEGMPMAILEAWAYKIPVIMTKACNLSEAFELQAAIEIDTNPDSIAIGIQKIINANNTEINLIKKAAFKILKEKYTWGNASKAMLSVYRWLLGNEKKPNCVILD